MVVVFDFLAMTASPGPGRPCRRSRGRRRPREIGFEGGIGTEEIEGGGAGGEFAVARGHDGFVGIDGVELLAALQIDDARDVKRVAGLAATENLVEPRDQFGISGMEAAGTMVRAAIETRRIPQTRQNLAIVLP